jgi:hypothetical protein
MPLDGIAAAFYAGRDSSISKARVIRRQAAALQPLYVATKGLP